MYFLKLLSVLAVIISTNAVIVAANSDAVTDLDGLSTVVDKTITGEGQIIPTKSTIFITGGATGIGLGYAKRFVSEGHTVIVCGRRQSKLDEAVKEVPELKTFTCDVEKAEGRVAIFEKISSDYPDMNVFVNNAAVILTGSPELSEIQTWDKFEKEFNINILGAMHLSMLFTPMLKEKEKAVIVQVSSIVGLFPSLAISSYGASKFAMHSFAMSMRMHLKGTNVKIVEIFPGPVQTDILPARWHEIALTVEKHTSDVFDGFAAGKQEIGDSFQPGNWPRLSKDELDSYAASINGLESIY